jgi:hypothetical protein
LKIKFNERNKKKMSKLKELVPPPELCKLIPAGSFEDCALVWIEVEIPQENKKEWRVIAANKIFRTCHNPKHPAPTLQEILEELRKNQEDVFLKWSPKAYHSWLVNAYTHDKEDYQDHNSSAVTAALTVWLKMKGIKNADRL